MHKGDVYNQKYLSKRLTEDDDAVGNAYWNNGYIFYNLEPAEVNVVGDSIDPNAYLRGSAGAYQPCPHQWQ